MKLASVGPTPAAYGFILVGLIGAVLGEIVLLRSASLTVIYIGIVVFESLLVLTYATNTSGHLNMPQLLGVALVIGGFAVVTMTEQRRTVRLIWTSCRPMLGSAQSN